MLSELLDVPIQIFHVSCEEAAEEIRRAQQRGLKIFSETCPQYFVLQKGISIEINEREQSLSVHQHPVQKVTKKRFGIMFD